MQALGSHPTPTDSDSGGGALTPSGESGVCSRLRAASRGCTSRVGLSVFPSLDPSALAPVLS